MFMQNFAQTLPLVLLTAFLVALYFLPWLISKNRQMQNSATIFVINLFLGWTLICWVVCLAWSVAGKNELSNPFTPRGLAIGALSLVSVAAVFAALMTAFPTAQTVRDAPKPQIEHLP